ncbi:MAG TPA: fumarylacetoacetate hydrolase family protein [Flavobacteriaceae bacterium]|nr:fumarylacetoacetate hydrolase family protein [Flavobacteriaceae bacterium]
MTNEQIAQILDNAAHEAKAVQQMAANENFSLEDAYTIQQISINRRLERGEKITGFKLGFTSKAKMEQMNVHDLIWGFLTDEMEIQANEKVDLARWIHPRAEPEIAFRVSQDFPDRELGLEELPEYLDKMAVAIEIIDSRYENFKFSLEDVVADNCSSTGYVIGDWQDLEQETCLAGRQVSDLDIELKINDEVIQKGKTSAILGNPLQPVIELSRLASDANIAVKEGYVILAGAATAAEYLKPKQEIEAEVENLGDVRFKT